MNKKDVDFEELLKNIYDNKSAIENEKIEISKKLEDVSKLKKSLERDNSKLLEQEQEIINNLKNNPRTVCMAVYNGNEMFTNRIHFDQNCSILKRHLKNDGVYYYSCLLSDDFIKNASFCPLCSPSALTVDRVGEIFE